MLVECIWVISITWFVSDKSIEPKLEKGKHNKVDDAVTVDKKHSNNDIQRSEEENNQQQQQPTTNTVFW